MGGGSRGFWNQVAGAIGPMGVEGVRNIGVSGRVGREPYGISWIWKMRRDMAQSSSTLRTESELREGRKYFTLAEARRALPLVKRVAADIEEMQELRLSIHSELSAGLAHMQEQEQARLQQEFDRATDRLGMLIEELARIGVELKDASRVLLDFPSWHEGREILLCWKADETTITYWHEVDGGYSGRKPIALLDE